MYTGLSATFNVYGKSFMRLQAVYLSGAPLASTTFYNPFSAVPKLSASYPGFNGIKLPETAYSTNFENTITINMPVPVRLGFIDVIVQNPAGYGLLTRYTVKELYSQFQTLSTLRPWVNGVQVLSGLDVTIGVENQILTISGDALVTIAGENIVSL
jgi:hypothetical protein